MNTCKKFVWKTQRGRRIDNGKNTRGTFGSSATLIGHKIWVIGGSNGVDSFFTLNVTTSEWETVPVHFLEVEHAKTHLNLTLHTANLFEDKIYIFGVQYVRLPKSDELWVFDPLLGVLGVKPTFGESDRPGYKEAHSADVCERLRVLALFGGEPFRGLGNRQLSLLDLDSFQWTMPKTKGTLPPSKAKHSSTMVGTRLFIHSGGRHGNPTHDLYVIDLVQRAQLAWHRVDLQGQHRKGTRGSAMSHVGSGRFIIFGGYCDLKSLNELLVIENGFSRKPYCSEVVSANGTVVVPNLESSEPLTYSGNPPGPRECSRMIFGHGKVYILGGNYNDNWNYFELQSQ